MSSTSSTVLVEDSLTTAKKVLIGLRKTRKSAYFLLRWPHNVALATLSRPVFFQCPASQKLYPDSRVSRCNRNFPSDVPGGYFRGRYLHPVVCSCSCSPSLGQRPADVKNRAGAGGQISDLHFSGPYERRGSDHPLGSAGGEANSSVLCLLNTLHFSSCCPATDRPRRSRDEALSPGGGSRDH